MPIQLSGSLVITGSITTTGVITMSGSIASASYSSNSDLLQGTGSVGFATTASLLTVSSSQQQISASLLNVIAIGATTGSNSFRANQSITGSLMVSSTITAQTLVVQTVTSSIVYSSGSNIFGSQLSDRQTFTGSMNVTGSGTFAGSITAGGRVHGTTTGLNSDFSSGGLIAYSCGSTLKYTQIGFDCIGNYGWIQPLHQGTSYTNLVLNGAGGNVGIGIATPCNLLHIEASNNTSNQFRVNSCDGLNAGVRSYTTCDGSGLIINHYYAVSGAPYLRTSDFISNQSDAAATQMRFFTKAASVNAALAMIISSGGCVGINTSSPNSLLEVQNCSNSPYLNTNALTSGQWLRVSNPSSCIGATSGILFQAQGPGGGNGLATINGSVVSCGSMSLTFATRDCSGNVEEKMRIVSSGTVAIGTQTATPLPHVGACAGGLIVQGLAGNRGLIEVWDATSGKGIFQQVGGTTYIGNLCKGTSGGDLRFLVNGIGPSATEAMVITCAGRVLINNSTPQNTCADYSRVTISGAYAKTNNCAGFLGSVLHLTSCENDYPFGAKFFIGGDACSTNRFLSIQTGDHNISNQGNIIFQQSGGKVGIGTTTPSRLLEVNGDVTLGGNNYIASNKMIQWEGGAYYSLRTISSGQTFQVYRGDTGLSPLQILNNGTAQYYGDFSGGNYYTADTTPSMCMLAPGQCINFCYMSGMLVVNDWNNGSTTLYLAGGGSTTMVANAIAQTGCFWYNPTVVGYSWSNTSGATRCYGFFVIRTRPNA